MNRVIIALIASNALLMGVSGASVVPTEGLASYYTRESCRREGTGGADIRMANGQKLDDSAMTCASWHYPFGTELVVYCEETGRSVVVTVTDRGPGRGPMRRGVVIDLTRAAFEGLGVPLSRGLVAVNIQEVRE
jgi:rare lipoprotein A